MQIKKWSFKPSDPNLLANRWTSSSRIWEGWFITSGQVMVDYEVLGNPRKVVTSLAVRPRGGVWSASTPWQGKISFVQGEGPGCGGIRPDGQAGTGLIGAVGWVNSLANRDCRPDIKSRVQIDPFGEAGYRPKRHSSGPNANYWYVEDAWWFLEMTSQLNRGVWRTSTQYSLWTGTQADSCESKGLGRSSNFWEFNSKCRPQANFGNFIWGAWEHEFQHYENARAELRQDENNLYFQVEALVSGKQDEVIGPLTDFHRRIQNRMRAAAGHENISGNWQGSVWIWKSQTANHFTKINNVSF